MNWSTLSDSVNNSFFFVIEKIIDLQEFFISQALGIGKVVFAIALVSTALNYALTGTGLKENLIKILKATTFFMIVIFAYPSIIGFITNWTFSMAQSSIYPSVNSYYTDVIQDEQYSAYIVTDNAPSSSMTFTWNAVRQISRDSDELFSDLTVRRNTNRMNYTSVSPAAIFKIIFFMAGECFNYADDTKRFQVIPETSRVLKGLVCGFFIIITGISALLHYLICFLEFMLVATVGVILFPLSIWEGSKFMAEKFIGAIIGFFIKLLFVNFAIFFMIYGFVSLFYIITGSGFTGSVDQILFIIFICLMFFLICKSAPAIAQSLLFGTPNLSAAGAVSAAAGAIGGAAVAVSAVGGAARQAGSAAAGGTATAVFAGTASKAVRDRGGSKAQQAGVFFFSLEQDDGEEARTGTLGLTRNLLGGGGSNTQNWQKHFIKSKKDGENFSAEDTER